MFPALKMRVDRATTAEVIYRIEKICKLFFLCRKWRSTLLAQDHTTAAELAATLVRNEILEGGIKPNTRLKVQHLSKRYGVGTTPLREALTQLSAAGLVIQTSQRGFQTPGLSRAGWVDLIKTREILETEALRLALENRTVAWEDNIVASFHLFVREIERLFQKETESIQRYWYRHSEFHHALVAACPLENLKSLISTLYTRMIPYRRLTVTDKYSKNKLIRAHEALMRDTLSGSPSALATMRDHISVNADIIKQVLASLDRKDGLE